MKKLYCVYTRARKGHPVARVGVCSTRRQAQDLVDAIRDNWTFNGAAVRETWYDVELGITILGGM